jgi:hypothetical protein
MRELRTRPRPRGSTLRLSSFGARGSATMSWPQRTLLYSRSGGCRITALASKERTKPRPRLRAFLNGRRMPFGKAGHGMGVQHNSLRYATLTGTVLLRWDGARQPHVWTVPAPDMSPLNARLELVRRYLHIFGPATELSFARWAGIRPTDVSNAFKVLAGELTPVHTPIGMLGSSPATRQRFWLSPDPLHPHACCRVAMRTSSCGELTELLSYLRSNGELRCGRHASGPVHYSSAEKLRECGAGRRAMSRLRHGAVFPRRNAMPSRLKRHRSRYPVSMNRFPFAGLVNKATNANLVISRDELFPEM